LREIIEIRKKIERMEITEVEGIFVDEWIRRAEKFVNKAAILLDYFEMRRKVKIIQKTYYVMHMAVAVTLRDLGIRVPKDESEVLSAFKKELIEKRGLDPIYVQVWSRVRELKSMVDENREDEIPDEEAYEMREYIRRLIFDLAKIRAEEKVAVPILNADQRINYYIT